MFYQNHFLSLPLSLCLSLLISVSFYLSISLSPSLCLSLPIFISFYIIFILSLSIYFPLYCIIHYPIFSLPRYSGQIHLNPTVLIFFLLTSRGLNILCPLMSVKAGHVCLTLMNCSIIMSSR